MKLLTYRDLGEDDDALRQARVRASIKVMSPPEMTYPELIDMLLGTSRAMTAAGFANPFGPFIEMQAMMLEGRRRAARAARARANLDAFLKLWRARGGS